MGSPATNSRAGVRSKQKFDGERFLVEATIVGAQRSGAATLAALFDDAGKNRIENNRLGTREKRLKLGIARRGDNILYLVNGEVGLQKSIPPLPAEFKVMLYVFGSTQNDWDSALAQTRKQ